MDLDYRYIFEYYGLGKQGNPALACEDLYFKLVPEAPGLPIDEVYEVVEYIMDMTIKGHKEQKNKTTEVKENKNPVLNYDYEKDYRFIWDSFKSKRNIDLNKDKITWWEFETILECMRIESIMTPQNKGSFESLKSLRIWEEEPKGKALQDAKKQQYNAFMQRMKMYYSLENNEESIEQNNQGALSMLKDYIIASID